MYRLATKCTTKNESKKHVCVLVYIDYLDVYTVELRHLITAPCSTIGYHSNSSASCFPLFRPYSAFFSMYPVTREPGFMEVK